LGDGRKRTQAHQAGGSGALNQLAAGGHGQSLLKDEKQWKAER
jgi:hypothetical protein